MKVKEESEKAGLKLSIQKTKILAFGPITSWQIDGETVERVKDFIFGGSKITAGGDCSHEIKRRLLFGRKAITNLCCCVASVMSDSVRPHRQQPTRLPCPWDSPGKNTGVGCHFLLHYNNIVFCIYFYNYHYPGCLASGQDLMTLWL